MTDDKNNAKRQNGHKQHSRTTKPLSSSSSSSREVKRKMAGITFAVPAIKSIKQRGIMDASFLIVARSIVLAKLEELLWIERIECLHG